MQNTIHQDLELIERYFESTLSLEELDLVSERLEHDPVFKKRLERYEQIHIKVNSLLPDVEEKEKRKADWKVMLQEEQVKSEAKIRSGNFRKYFLAVAASVALLVAAFGVWNSVFVKQDVGEMATQYWKETDKTKQYGERGEGQEDRFLNLLNEAGKAYKEKQFQKVYLLLEEIPDSYSQYYVAVILHGKSLLQEGKEVEAVAKFEEVVARPDGGGRGRALWFQALAYLKLGEVEKAKVNLNFIVENDYPLAGKAEEILGRLR